MAVLEACLRDQLFVQRTDAQQAVQRIVERKQEVAASSRNVCPVGVTHACSLLLRRSLGSCLAFVPIPRASSARRGCEPSLIVCIRTCFLLGSPPLACGSNPRLSTSKAVGHRK